MKKLLLALAAILAVTGVSGDEKRSHAVIVFPTLGYGIYFVQEAQVGILPIRGEGGPDAISIWFENKSGERYHTEIEVERINFDVRFFAETVVHISSASGGNIRILLLVPDTPAWLPSTVISEEKLAPFLWIPRSSETISKDVISASSRR